MQEDEKKDGYKLFWECFKIKEEKLIDFAICHSIFVEPEKAREQWEYLKCQLLNNKPLTIRGVWKLLQL